MKWKKDKNYCNIWNYDEKKKDTHASNCANFEQ